MVQKNVFFFFFVASLLMVGCNKEDLNTLFSRQYIISDELAESIANLNKDIQKLQDLYGTITDPSTIISNYEYVTETREGKKDTIAIQITIDSKIFRLPFGRNGKDGRDGKDGKDGSTPTISISSDGFWVINGEKTPTTAAGRDGKDGKDGSTPTISISSDGFWIINGEKTNVRAVGVDGQNGQDGAPGRDGKDGKDGKDGQNGENGLTPEIGVAKDPDNPADENFYWTVKYPNETNYRFIVVDGHKLPATGPQGPQGERGPEGPMPTVVSPIDSINVTPDETAIVIYASGNRQFTIPLKTMVFKVEPTGLAEYAEDTRVLLFTQEGQTITLPYTASDNVKHISATLPAGWTFKVDISNNSSERKIHITSPYLYDIDKAMFEGTASFIAFDQDGSSISRFLQIAMKKYVYLSYVFNRNASVVIRNPKSVNNKLEISPASQLYNFFYTYLPNGTFANREKYNFSLDNDSIKKYPGYRLEKKLNSIDQEITITSFLFDNTCDLLTIEQPSESDTTNKIGLYPKIRKEGTDNNVYIYPVGLNNYVAKTSFILNNGSNNEIIRLKRATAEMYVSINKASEFFGVNKTDFDFNKVNLKMEKTVYNLKPSLGHQYMAPTLIDSTYATYHSDKDSLVFHYGTFGLVDSNIKIYFYYDKVGKKSFNSDKYEKRIEGNTTTYFYINSKFNPGVFRSVAENPIYFIDWSTGRGTWTDNSPSFSVSGSSRELGGLESFTDNFPTLRP